MDIRQLNLTNAVLLVLAVTSVLQTIALVAAVVVARRAYRSAATAVDRLKVEQIDPLLDEARQVRHDVAHLLRDARGAVRHLTAVTGGIESRADRLFSHYDAANDHIASMIDTGLDALATSIHEVRAVERGVRRGVRTLLSKEP